MKSYLLDIELETPVAQRGRIALDGIAAWSAYASTGRLDAVLPFARLSPEGELLESGKLENGMVHAASILYRPASDVRQRMVHIRSVRPVVNFKHGNEHDSRYGADPANSTLLIPDMQRGDFQNLMNEYSVVHPAQRGGGSVSHRVFFRFTGNGEEVLDLISDLPAIGKKWSAGFGWIAERDGRPAIQMFEIKGPGIPGLVGGDGLPERVVPIQAWRRLEGADLNPSREYATLTVPRFLGEPIDCAVPNEDFGYVGYSPTSEGLGAPMVSLSAIQESLGRGWNASNDANDVFELA
jgi:hypothetical protein